MKQLSIFDIPTEEIIDTISEEEIEKQFSILQDISKEHDNSYFIGISNLPLSVKNCLKQFEEKGWIEKRLGNGVCILDPFLAHKSPEEIAAIHQERLDMALENPNVSWYENVLHVANFSPTPIRYKNKEMQWKTRQLIDEITKNAAKKLGLKHFLEVPSSRGMKINPISSKWARNHVLPMILEKIIPIKDMNEMEDFFHYHVFFMGRRDWDKKGYSKNYQIPPYPEFKRIVPSVFDIACLCEATEAKTIKLILEYAGSAHGCMEREKDDMIYLYPEGWSFANYESTLTDEDKLLIKEDQERLERLHGKK
ncbi:hypothetical protein [Oceanobacillus oncorhynchi]|uniref:hypothetical protein n=1 Tax=Oceanobacillus oncorhynchi TaxID=545501 RepID=UPI001868C9AE|nr:hypothetical protein [Oceanobacillus oncorhynchi]